VKTLEEYDEIAAKAARTIRAKAAAIVSGGAATATGAAPAASEAEASKKGRGVLGKARTDAVVVEITDSTSNDPNAINIPYILWGYSMKPQIAGVQLLVVPSASPCHQVCMVKHVT
jgi:hypothetical protein